MKKIVLFDLLILGIILISGCVEQPEEKAKQLADGTAEGSAIIAIMQSTKKIKDCTIDEIISITEEMYVKQGMEKQGVEKFDPSAEEIAQMESLLESAKRCPQKMEKSASKISETEYLVSYSFAAQTADCQQFSMGPNSENFIQIEVNTATGTTNVIKGAFSEEQRQGVQAQIQSIKDMGNCGSLMTMAFVSAGPSAEVQPVR